MRFRIAPGLVAAFITLLMTAISIPLHAEEEEKLGWSDVADFSLVATDGNAETETLGFKNKLLRRWKKAVFELNAGGIRAESTTVSRLFAVGPNASNFNVTRETRTEKTAENYYLNGKYGRTITERFFWYTGAGWDRNEFAGIKNRYAASGGGGNIWVDEEKVHFLTDYALTYTDQEDVVEDPNVDDTFPGFRFSWTYKHDFTETTTYGNDLILDANLDESDDWRGNMINWVAVNINSHLALKVSLQWLYDNLPSLGEVPLFDADPDAGGVEQPDSPVLVELDDLDTLFTISLVVNF